MTIGRPTKLTPERANSIVRAISSGTYQVIAAKANGVSESTFYDWVKRGREAPRDDDGNLIDPEHDGIYAEFSESVGKAEAEAEMRNVLLIQQAAQSPSTWTAAAWYLERKYPNRWGRKDHVTQEVSGPKGGPVEVSAEASVLGFLAERRAAIEETDTGDSPVTDPSTEGVPPAGAEDSPASPAV